MLLREKYLKTRTFCSLKIILEGDCLFSLCVEIKLFAGISRNNILRKKIKENCILTPRIIVLNFLCYPRRFSMKFFRQIELSKILSPKFIFPKFIQQGKCQNLSFHFTMARRKKVVYPLGNFYHVSCQDISTEVYYLYGENVPQLYIKRKNLS